MMRKIFLSLLILFFSSSTMAATLSGTIYGGSDPLEGATVSVTIVGGTTPIASVVTDTTGTYYFPLADNTYNLDISAPESSGFGDSVVNNIVISGADIVQNVVLLIAAPTTFKLSGTVKNSEGVVIHGSYVTAYDQVSGAYSGGSAVDSSGVYSIDVPAGTYKLLVQDHEIYSNPLWDSSVSPTDWSGKWYENITVTGDTTENLTIPFITITGKVTDANGVPVPNVYIQAYDNWMDGSMNYYIRNTVTSDANGDYSMVILPGLNQIIISPPVNSGFIYTILTSLNIQTDILQNIILPLTDTTTPVIISAPVITAITDTTAIVTWQTNEPSTSVVSYGEGIGLGSSASTPGYTRDHSVLLTGLTSENLHSVQVNSTDEAGNGPTSSNAVTFTTLATPDTTAPVILEGPILSSITHNSAVVEWTTDEAATTKVNYGIGTSLGAGITDGNLTTHHKVHLTSLSANTTYSVQVSSIDAKGNGPSQSSMVSFTTLGIPDTKEPVIIAGPLVTDITKNAATVVWQTGEPATSGVSYHDGTLHGLVRDETLSTEHSVQLTNLSALTPYFFTVSSEDALGNGPTLSQESTFTTLGETDTQGPLITDEIKIVGISWHSAVLHWDTDEPSNAVIQYGLSESNLTLQAADSTLKQKHNFQLTGLQENTTYYLRIYSTDAMGNTEAGNIVSFTTLDLPDTAAPSFTVMPTVLKATDRSVTIGWETDEPTEYQILYGIGSERNLQKANGAKKTKHQVILNNLEASQSYGYTVIITDTAGNQQTFESN